MLEESCEDFLGVHKQQLQLSGVPEHYWNTLYNKVNHTIFDAGDVFSLLKIDYEDDERGDFDPAWELYLNNDTGMNVDDPKHIYLIDHAWTFSINDARQQLKSNENLRVRMATIMGLEHHRDDDLKIFNELWKYCDCYWVGNAEKAEDRIAVWYMMDEVGAAIKPSENANFKMVPFIHISENIVYSIIFPVRNISHGEVVTRRYMETVTDKAERAALFLPWVDISFHNVDYRQDEPSASYFLSGYIQESLPVLSKLQNLCVKSKYKVYSEYDLINQYLTDESFEIVSSLDDADIVWYTTHFKNFEELSDTPGKFVNQFPFEYVLTIKDLLCIITRRLPNKTLMPVTYNLKAELPKFVSYFQFCKKLNIDNHWIIKPFNLARGLDTYITNNVNCIVRLAISGPKIAQKYIEKPVLYYRSECNGHVKFDIRYVILLKQVKPLQVFIYKNFFLRFANEAFSLDEFDKYCKHFTVMNYIDDAKHLKRVLCDEFQEKWSEQHIIPWKQVEVGILNMLRDVFNCAVMQEPPCGIAHNPQSRALYAADIMLMYNEHDEIESRLLEINWMPDCKRACEYYPDFYNDIFKLLFLNVDNPDVFYSL